VVRANAGFLRGSHGAVFRLVMIWLQHFSAIESGYRVESEKQIRRATGGRERQLKLAEAATDAAGRIDMKARELDWPNAARADGTAPAGHAEGGGPVIAQAMPPAVHLRRDDICWNFGMVASHPSRKNKDAARWGTGNLWHGGFPTLAARTETGEGGAPGPFHETIQIGGRSRRQPGHADSYRATGFSHPTARAIPLRARRFWLVCLSFLLWVVVITTAFLAPVVEHGVHRSGRNHAHFEVSAAGCSTTAIFASWR